MALRQGRMCDCEVAGHPCNINDNMKSDDSNTWTKAMHHHWGRAATCGTRGGRIARIAALPPVCLCSKEAKNGYTLEETHMESENNWNLCPLEPLGMEPMVYVHVSNGMEPLCSL